LRGSERRDHSSVNPGRDLAGAPGEIEFNAVPGVGCDRDGASIICGAAVGHDGVVTRTVPVQNAELSTHAQGLRDGVGHHHMRYVVLVERDLEIGIVPSVDIRASAEDGQIAQAVEYVV